MNVNENNATMRANVNATAEDATIAVADQITHRQEDVDVRQNRHHQEDRTYARSVIKLINKEQIIVVPLQCSIVSVLMEHRLRPLTLDKRVSGTLCSPTDAAHGISVENLWRARLMTTRHRKSQDCRHHHDKSHPHRLEIAVRNAQERSHQHHSRHVIAHRQDATDHGDQRHRHQHHQDLRHHLDRHP